MMKKLICIALSFFVLSQFTACGSEPSEPAPEPTAAPAAENTINLNGGSIEVSGSGMAVSGSTVTISEAGTYTVSGKLSDGQIVVDVPGEGM